MGKENIERKKAAMRVLELLKADRPKEVIVYRILIEHGYSERFVDSVIKAYVQNMDAINQLKTENE